MFAALLVGAAFLFTTQTTHATPFDTCLSASQYCTVVCNDGTTVIYNTVEQFANSSAGKTVLQPTAVCAGSAGSGGIKSATVNKADANGGGPKTQIIPPGGTAQNLGNFGNNAQPSPTGGTDSGGGTAATATSGSSPAVSLGDPVGTYACGGNGHTQIHTTIDFGCKGQGNATLDLIFAIVRFLSAGAGVIVIGSLVFAGIQYTTSRGDPNASAAAMKRIQNTLIALLIYIFAFAILNYVVPAGLLK